MPFDGQITSFAPAKVDPLSITDPRERLKYLAEFLRGLPAERFDVNSYYSRRDGRCVETSEEAHECGTAACIAGWAITLFSAAPVQHTINGNAGHLEAIASALLGVSGMSAHHLFYPWWQIDKGPTASQAASTLDHLAVTGKVDWSKARA